MRPPLFILAGGKGTRLREITGPDIPKPMADVHGRPFLYWLIEEMRRQGFEAIRVNTGYKAEVIENYPWPTGWNLEFERDLRQQGPDVALLHSYFTIPGVWICNGDTFPLASLPKEDLSRSLIGTYNDMDSGFQQISSGQGERIKPFRCPFVDIGTPEGLEQFREYVKTHLVER